MKGSHALSLALALAVSTATASPAEELHYPPGTSMDEAWHAPPRIAVDESADRLAALFLEHPRDGEVELDERDFEALKRLLGEQLQATEVEGLDDEERHFRGSIHEESILPEQIAFYDEWLRRIGEGLDVGALLERFGDDPAATEAAAWGGVGRGFDVALFRDDGRSLLQRTAQQPCIRQRPVLVSTEYEYKVGFNNVEVWGLAIFAIRVEYGSNNADLIHGFFPFGLRASWRGAIGCALSPPADAEGLKACGSTRTWKILDQTTQNVSMAVGHVVPGVALASVTWAGARLTGQHTQFRAPFQERPALDASHRLGVNNHPLPSWLSSWNHSKGPGVNNTYRFREVVTWKPVVLLNVGFNNPVDYRANHFTFEGVGGGNPHSIGNVYRQRSFSRHHPALGLCS